MRQSDLKKYARLIARIGVNIKKGQPVVISADVSDAYFVRYVVDECYKAGASSVDVEWSDDPVSVMHYRYMSTEALKEFPLWREEKLKYRAQKLPCMIHIESSDPDAFKAVDQEKMMDVRKAVSPIIWKYRKPMEDKYQWTIVALPGREWAMKLFPDDTPKAAVEKLWQAIMKTARLEGNPVANWKAHSADLDAKCAKLNAMKIKTLCYHNEAGTDFTVGLIPGTKFCGGKGVTRSGRKYMPNMPTEECFISPDKTTANGKVMASKPLSVMGKVIKDFGFVFKDGKVSQIIARSEEERALLERLTTIDEGASMLGEVALVPFDSPVNETGLLFFNTLFDENACCHLAIGRGFEEVIEGVEKMNEEQIAAFGINESTVHTDFMIGTSDLSITATTESGETVKIFDRGTWAI